MKATSVVAAIYCMPESGCDGVLIPLPVYRPTFDALVRDGAKRVRQRAFACFEIVAKRDGLYCDLGGGLACFELDDWKLAWDQLSIATNAQFTSYDAIATYRRVCDKIASGTIVRKRGQHRRKSNKSKSGAGAGDLDERCFVESIVHCRTDDETLYAAAKRALQTTSSQYLPNNLGRHMELVRADQGKTYGGRHSIREVVDILRSGVKVIEKRHGDSRAS